MLETERARILGELARHTGRRVPWDFIKNTSRHIPGIERFHNLITGIYKPAWSPDALSIVITLGSPYEHRDEVLFLDDGRWLMTYSPRSGGMEVPDNRLLLECMRKHIPIGVFRQLTDRTDRVHGSTYRVLGLGIISNYHPKDEVFVLESVDQAALDQVAGVSIEEEARYEIQLYARLTSEFTPFVREERTEYVVNAPKRDSAFRNLVLREYDFACSVCERKLRMGDLIEATAAHIVPKQVSGTDDPRNGLSLCRNHHWALDAGILTLSDDLTILVSPAANAAETNKFGLPDLAGKPILLPENDGLVPHAKAIAWHREHVWLGG